MTMNWGVPSGNGSGNGGSGRNPFLDALQNEYLNSQPSAAFNSVFPGAMQQNPYGRYLQNQQYRFLGGYMGAAAQDPSLTYTGYLKGLNPQDEFMGLAPSLRGETPSLYQPKARFQFGPGQI